MNSTQNLILPALVLAGVYFFFKDKIDPLLKKIFSNVNNGNNVNNNLSEPARHFQRSCNLDNEPMNAAMSVAKVLDGQDREDFIKHTIPVLVKKSLEKEIE